MKIKATPATNKLDELSNLNMSVKNGPIWFFAYIPKSIDGKTANICIQNKKNFFVFFLFVNVSQTEHLIEKGREIKTTNKARQIVTINGAKKDASAFVLLMLKLRLPKILLRP